MSFILGMLSMFILMSFVPHMHIPAGRSFTIAFEEIQGLGTTWIVRVYRKRFLRNKLISSDWFLDGVQARRFADQLARELSNNGHAEGLAARKPGWTLHRPKH